MKFDYLSKYFTLTPLYYYREGESVSRPHQCHSKFSVGASHFLLSSIASYQMRTDESKKSLFVHWNILDHSNVNCFNIFSLYARLNYLLC